ncbi:MAG: hypothetical protein ACW96M_00610 [Candidatus Thorarchaeota archaeon]
MTHQIGTKQEVRERARKALAEYLTMFIPGSWKEPLSKLKLLLQANGDVDWESLKGYALMIFDEQRLSEDRVECLARVERLSEAFKEIHSILSPAEWHKTVDDIIHAASFRASKAALHIKRVQIMEEPKVKGTKEVKTKS